MGWVIGLRLLALARRTRQVPELTMGLGLFLIGGVSYPLAIAGNQLAGPLPLVARICLVGGATTSHLGLVAHCVFTWRVFRPQAGWARLLVGASVLALVIGFAGSLGVGIEGAASDPARMRPWTFFLMVVATASFGWSGVEALGYHARLRRRLALGLSDPVLANRFLLWGTASAASTLGCVVQGYFVWTSPLSVLDPVALSVSGACGATSAVVMILTFLPPSGYLRLVEARHAARAAS